MSGVVVLVPVLGRPHRVRPTLDSIAETAPDATVLFIADPDDEAQLATLRDERAATLICPGSYARKINAGVRFTTAGLLFLGADDLRWTPGWLEACRAHIDAGAHVVGVNDLCARRTQRGDHATHFLITREYAERETVDGSRGPLFEGYDHSCVDDELVEVARSRGVLVIDPTIVVEHLHPDAGKAELDETYRRGRARIREDRKILRSRRSLWT